MAAFKRMTNVTTGSQSLSTDDRRSTCRYDVVQTHAWLGWWDDQEFRSTSARLVDLSVRGCKMTVDRLPPEDKPVWFCPPGATPSEWLEARLIESKRRLLGPRVVRIEFRTQFAYEKFKEVVFGPDALGGYMKKAEWVPEDQRDFW